MNGGEIVAPSRVLAATTLLCLLLCAWEIVAYRRVDPYGSDSSYYQVLADNLAEHKGYSFDFKPHTRYPPGFPALLAGTGAVFGRDYASYVRLMPVFGVIGLLSMFATIARDDRRLVAALACVWLASSPQFFRAATQDVLSDLPFFAFSAGALLAATARVPSPLLTSVCVAGAVSIRSAGVALIVALLATLGTRWRDLPAATRRALVLAAVTGVAVEAAWLSWALTHAAPDWPGEPMDSYLRQMALKDPREPALGAATSVDVIWRLGGGVVALAAHFSELLARLTWVAPLWFSPLVIVPIALVAAGLAVSLARGDAVLPAWYVVAYCGLFGFWPFDEGVRFVLPVFPLLVMFAIRGAEAGVNSIAARDAPHSHLAAWLFAAAVAFAWSAARFDAASQQARWSAVFWSAAAAAALFWVVRPHMSVRWSPRAAVAAATVLLAGIGVGLFGQDRIAAANRTATSPAANRIGVASVAAWLNSLPRNEVVMGQQTAILHRLTGRRVVSLPTVTDGSLLVRTMTRHDVAYVVVAEAWTDQYYRPSESARFEALAAAAPGCCDLIYAQDGYRVYRVARR